MNNSFIGRRSIDKMPRCPSEPIRQQTRFNKYFT